MKLSTHKYTTKMAIIGDESFPISFTPAAIMNDKDAFFKVSPNGDLAVVGYLVDDSYRRNPLEASDGIGKIVTARGNADEKQHIKMQKALGLDSNWGPDLDQISDSSIQRAFLDAAVTDKAIIESARANAPTLTVQAYAENLVENGDMSSSAIYKKVRMAAWWEGRENGTIGDPLAIPLDVYEHGNVAYSITGTGKQDTFDAAGGALWIPNTFRRENIEYLALKSLLPAGTEARCVTISTNMAEIRYVLPNGSEHGPYDDFVDAIKAAEKALNMSVDRTVILQRMREAALECATDAVQQYTDWVNGNTFGYIIDSFEKTDNGEWENVNTEKHYGIVDKYVMEAMNEEAESTATYQKEQNEKTFVACDEKALPILTNANAFISDYDPVKGGVTITMTDEVQKLINAMPADFALKNMSVASGVVKSFAAEGSVCSVNTDNSPSY